MPPGERREYAGNAPPTTLTSNIDNATLTIPLANATGWPTGVTGPFFFVIDKGLTTEEKIKGLSRTGNTVTVSPGGRGVDGTAAATHSAGAACEHVITADDMNQQNQHLADPTLDHHTQYLTTGRHASPALHGTASLDLAQLLDSIWPAGVMLATAGGVPATETTPGRRDWLPCDAAAVSRTTYSRLFAAIGTTYGVGDGTTTFNVPDSRGRLLMGSGTGPGLTARTHGQAIGTETVALALANMPAHTHTVNAHSHGGTLTSAVETQEHTHTANHNHSGSIAADGTHFHIANFQRVRYIGYGTHSHDYGANYMTEAPGGSSPASNATIDVDLGGSHGHGLTVNTNNFSSGGRSATHNHGVTLTSEGPATNSQGSGTAFTVLQPALVVTRMIKS